MATSATPNPGHQTTEARATDGVKMYRVDAVGGYEATGYSRRVLVSTSGGAHWSWLPLHRVMIKAVQS